MMNFLIRKIKEREFQKKISVVLYPIFKHTYPPTDTTTTPESDQWAIFWNDDIHHGNETVFTAEAGEAKCPNEIEPNKWKFSLYWGRFIESIECDPDTIISPTTIIPTTSTTTSTTTTSTTTSTTIAANTSTTGSSAATIPTNSSINSPV